MVAPGGSTADVRVRANRALPPDGRPAQTQRGRVRRVAAILRLGASPRGGLQQTAQQKMQTCIMQRCMMQLLARPAGAEDRVCRRVRRCITLHVMSKPFSLRMDDGTHEHLLARTERTGASASQLVNRYVKEGLRMDEYPGVGFVTAPDG